MINKQFSFLALVLLITSPGLSSVAAEGQASWQLTSEHAARPAGEGQPALLEDPQVLEQFVFEHVRDKMAEAHIPGAVFLAIKDGEVIYRQGFGYADLETRQPIDPATTMFRIASISKTFLGTTAMRIVSKGQMSLDDSIEEIAPSIDIARRKRFDGPVTVRNSLTHSTGFRDLFLNSSAPSIEKFEGIAQTIRNYLSDQGAPSGKYTYYCNICISMTAAAMQDITGEKYEDLVTKEVFEPLGMKYAVLDIPTNPRRDELAKFQAKQYVYDDDTGEYTLHGEFLRNLYPPSSVAISADEIAKYMLMHMNGGLHEGQPFLSTEAHAEMHRHQSSNHELIPGYRITFKEGRRNGVEYYGHSGDSRGNDSTMLFLPDYNFGFFLSYTGDNDTFYRDVIQAFFDAAFPPQTESFSAEKKSRDDMLGYEGMYTNFRYDEPTPMQLVWPMFGQYKVTATEGGLLSIDFPGYYFKGGSAKYAQVDGSLFRKVDSGEPNRIGDLLVDYLIFESDESGNGVAFMSNIQNHSFVMTRVPAWKAEANFQNLLKFAGIGMAAVVGISVMILLWQVIARFALKKPATSPLLCGKAGWCVFGAAITGLGFLAAFLITLFNTRPLVNLTYGFDDLGLEAYFVLPLISLALFLVSLILVTREWIRAEKSMNARIALTVSLIPIAVWTFLAYGTHILGYYFS